ncbi:MULTISPECIES: DUF4179 domain-containing protein [Bacillus]|uniref:DUF4179 domain-containing protein n=1 Tax=Bacillus TaxID=1386 RepID=UPI000BB7D966|nr:MULTISPECIES: DUF4179 domain-containing protein [Bacillus]
MFENEEKKLHEMKDKIDKVEVPSNIDEYILKGMHQAKEKKRTFHSSFRWGAIAASVLLLIMFTSIKVSPTFAGYVSSIPGMQKIVELMRNDKGMISIIENEYLQIIDTTVEENGVKLTIDAIIVDEDRAFLYYTIETDKSYREVILSEARFTDKEGNELPLSSGVYSHGNVEKNTPISGELLLAYPVENQLPSEIILHTGVKADGVDVLISQGIPITIDYEKFSAIKKVYEVNETVAIEGQKILVEKVEIRPTRIAVSILYDELNTHKIFAFDNIRLMDEKGEIWTEQTASISFFETDPNRFTLYFESNYFAEPKELYLEFSSVRALPKDEVELVVDIEQEEIIQQPSDNRFISVTTSFKDIVFEYQSDDSLAQGAILSSTYVDANGTEFRSSFFHSGDRLNNIREIGFELFSEAKSPLTFTITDYPNRLKGDVGLKLK